MRFSVRLALIALSSVACAAAFAQSAVGTWTGRVDFSAAKPKDANEKQMIASMAKAFANATAKLQMRKNNTYRMDFSAVGGSKPQSEEGKWSQSGKTVTVIDPKGKKETMTLSSDGKKMIMTPRADEHAPAGLRMVFTRN